jgi:membrane fusion protein (multidrug efflux system)
MRKISLVAMMISMIVFIGINANAQTDDMLKKGYPEYINYLKANKDALNYNTYGLIEGLNETVLKIYCHKHVLGQLVLSLEDFEYDRYEVKAFDEDQIVVSIYFPSPGKIEAEEAPKPETGIEKKPEIQETRPVIQPQPDVEKKDCPGRVKVQVRKMEYRTFSEYKYFEDVLSFDRDVELRTQLTASVKEVAVADGDRVHQDQILVRLDSTVIEKEINSVEELIKNWKTILRKRQNWKVRSPAAEKQAQEKIQEAETLLAEKMDDLSKTQIKAPFDGKVIYIISEGEPLETGATVLRMISDQLLKVDVPAEDAELFSPGMDVRVSPVDGEAVFQGRVETSDTETKIVLDNEDLKLSEGMKVGFKVLLKEHDQALVIPEKEVLKDDSGYYAFVAVGKRAALRRLEIGATESGMVHVLSGINAGEEVIATGLNCLQDGKKIKVMIWDAELGKLRVRKKKDLIAAPVVEPERIEIPEVTVEPAAKKKNYWRLGGGLGLCVGTGSVFSDVYGSFAPGGFITASYTIREKVEIFFSTTYITASGKATGLDDKVTLTMIPVYIGAKLHLNKIKKFSPFVGAAMARYNTKESFPAGDELHESTSYYSNFGGSGFVGVYYPLGKKLDLTVTLKYDFSKVSMEEGLDSVDLSGLRLLVGVTYVLGR